MENKLVPYRIYRAEAEKLYGKTVLVEVQQYYSENHNLLKSYLDDHPKEDVYLCRDYGDGYTYWRHVERKVLFFGEDGTAENTELRFISREDIAERFIVRAQKNGQH